VKSSSGREGSQSTAIGKTLAVLEALAQHERLGEIAQATGLPKSTVHRILRALVDHDFARAAGDGSYLAGPRILSIAGQVLSGFDYARQIGPALRELQATSTGLTVHFALLTGTEATYVEKLESTGRPYQLASRVGMRLALHCTGIGKAILAGLPDEEARRLVDEAGAERRTPNTLTTWRDLRAELERVRARGFAIDDEENEANTRCVAAAVYDHQGRVAGGVSVSSLTFLLSTEQAGELGPYVVDAARRVSTALGAPGDRPPKSDAA
jgi:IclR family transcriptional regulator, acetate operon repressor